MIALLLNSGLGSRMGDETREHPKCMCRLTEQETIISWQVKLLRRIGVTEAVVTTGHLADTLIAYLESLDSGIRFHFVHNPKYRETNYIYSMYLARNLLRGQDVISLHGDLVLHPAVMALRVLRLCVQVVLAALKLLVQSSTTRVLFRFRHFVLTSTTALLRLTLLTVRLALRYGSTKARF